MMNIHVGFSIHAMARYLSAQLRRRALPALLLLLFTVMMPACASSKPTVVLLVGGAGLSQLGELGENISAICPDAEVIETGGWDGFRADVHRIALNHSGQGLVLIGHSFGCQTIARDAAQIPGIDLVVMIDPAWDDITLPPTIRSCFWYQRSQAGLERTATIRNGGSPMIIASDHNDICHSPRLISEVTQAVRGISERNATQQRIRTMLAPH